MTQDSSLRFVQTRDLAVLAGAIGMSDEPILTSIDRATWRCLWGGHLIGGECALLPRAAVGAPAAIGDYSRI
jgi:hypothetical protein